MNILKMAREGLRRDLTTALHKAVARREPVRHPGLRVKTNGDFTICQSDGPAGAAKPRRDCRSRTCFWSFSRKRRRRTSSSRRRPPPSMQARLPSRTPRTPMRASRR